MRYSKWHLPAEEALDFPPWRFSNFQIVFGDFGGFDGIFTPAMPADSGRRKRGMATHPFRPLTVLTVMVVLAVLAILVWQHNPPTNPPLFGILIFV